MEQQVAGNGETPSNNNNIRLVVADDDDDTAEHGGMAMYESVSQDLLDPMPSSNSALSNGPTSSSCHPLAHRCGGSWSLLPTSSSSSTFTPCRAAYATLNRLRGTNGSKGLLLGGFSDVDRTAGDLAHVMNFSSGEVEKLSLSPHLPEGLCQHTTESFDGENFFVLGNASALEWRPLVVNTAARTVKIARLTCVNGAFYPLNQHCHVSACFTVPPSPLRGTTETDQQIIMFGGAHIPDDGVATSAESHDYVFVLSVTRRQWRLVPKPFTAVVNRNAWPSKRLYHAGCAVENKLLYIFGGAPDCKNTTRDDPVYDDMWCFNADASMWRRVTASGTAPSKRGSCSMIYNKPFIYLYGGFDGSRSLTDMFRMNTVTEMWQEISMAMDPWAGKALRLPRWGAASCVSNNELFVVGGFTELVEQQGPGGGEQQAFSGRPYTLTDSSMKFSFEPSSLKLLLAQFIVCHIPSLCT